MFLLRATKNHHNKKKCFFFLKKSKANQSDILLIGFKTGTKRCNTPGIFIAHTTQHTHTLYIYTILWMLTYKLNSNDKCKQFKDEQQYQ